MATVKDAIIEARRILAEKNWCQKNWCQKKDGKSTFILDPEADAFCAIGATILASHNTQVNYWDIRRKLTELGYEITKDGGHNSIMIYNETKGRIKEEVLALFDFVISKME